MHDKQHCGVILTLRDSLLIRGMAAKKSRLAQIFPVGFSVILEER